MIHIRIEEKFGEYRKAFRQFDINKDNDLSFEEFVYGCEFCGIAMPIQDFKAVYNTIDYDGNGGIDFNKFCLLNSDRTKDIFGFIDENYTNTRNNLRTNDDENTQPPWKKSMKPPLGRKKFSTHEKETMKGLIL